MRRKWTTPEKGMKYESLFINASKRYGIPDGLLSRIAKQESNYDPNAFNHTSGATGLMQIIPRWHPGLDGDPAFDIELDSEAAYNPEIAIPYAAKYLRRLYNKFQSWALAVASYNRGQGNIAKDLKNYGAAWLSNTHPETFNYVTNVFRDTGLPFV